MQILALDMATRTGWALCVEPTVFSGVMTFDVKRGESPGMRFVRFNRWLQEIGQKMTQGDLVVYEQAHHRGGASTAVGVGFSTIVLTWAAEHHIEHHPVHASTLKKWATGDGAASKEKMTTEAARRFHRVPADDNEADALLLLAYAMEEVVGMTPPRPKDLGSLLKTSILR